MRRVGDESDIRAPGDRSLLVLISLAGGAKHGYALIKDVRDFSGVQLGPGTLYACFAKLERAGLIEALPADDRRHPYRITAPGLAVLDGWLRESARLTQIGLNRIAGALP